MNLKVKTLQEIAQIANLNVETLRLYLSRSEFSKYIRNEKINNRWRNTYLFNDDFKSDLCKFLELKKYYKNAKLLINYKESEKKMTNCLFKENETLKKDLDKAYCQNEKLQKELEIVSKQYESLLKHHNECLKAFKEEKKNNE